MKSIALSSPHFVDSPPLLLAGLREPLDQNAAQKIPVLWQTFAPYIGKLSHQVGNTCFGLCGANDASKTSFYYMAAVEVSDFINLPEKFSASILPSQRYAVFSHAEHASRIKETIDAIFDQWLPHANLRHANQSLHFFERYSEAYNPETGYGGTEIWLPIKNQ